MPSPGIATGNHLLPGGPLEHPLHAVHLFVDMLAAPILADHRIAHGLKRQRSEFGSRRPAVQLTRNLDRRLDHPHFVGGLTIFAIVARGEFGVRDDDFGNGGLVWRSGQVAAILKPLSF
jgi:hypothetical protein